MDSSKWENVTILTFGNGSLCSSVDIIWKSSKKVQHECGAGAGAGAGRGEGVRGRVETVVSSYILNSYSNCQNDSKDRNSERAEWRMTENAHLNVNIETKTDPTFKATTAKNIDKKTT